MENKLSVAFLGTPSISAQCLQAILEISDISVKVVITQPDRPAGRGRSLSFSAVKEVALTNNIPILQPGRIKKEWPQFKETLDAHGPFAGAVVAAFGQILPVSFLEYFDNKCVNVHPSLLPRWRGAAPYQHTLIAGDTVTGTQLMKMEADLDTGPIFSSQTVDILPSDTSDTLETRLIKASQELLKRDLVSILQGKITPQPQSSEGVTYASQFKNDDSKIDWNKDATTIANLIRGLWPKPGAFTFLSGKRLKIAFAEAENSSPSLIGNPGEIIDIDQSSCKIQCGSGTLSLKRVQLEGKPVMAIADFLRGNQVTKGTILTN